MLKKLQQMQLKLLQKQKQRAICDLIYKKFAEKIIKVSKS